MKVRLPDGAELFYVIDDYTDPWTTAPTVVLHHGMAQNHRLWYAWVPILSLTTCTSPIDFSDPHHLETAALVEREGIRTWVDRTITRPLDPEILAWSRQRNAQG